MATKKRTKGARINLTAEAYALVEKNAFKNCRTVAQELTFMVERALQGRPAPERAAEAWPTAPYAPAAGPAAAPPPSPEPAFDPEAEAEVEALFAQLGYTAAQKTAARLLNPSSSQLLASLRVEIEGEPQHEEPAPESVEAPAS